MENRKVFLNKHTNLLELEEHMYPLLMWIHRMYFVICFIMMRFRRLHLMTGLYLIICRMKYGSQTQHSEMVSSRELHIRLNRLFRFMNICTDSALKGKVRQSEFFYTVKRQRCCLSLPGKRV